MNPMCVHGAPDVQLDAGRLIARLDALGQAGALPGGGVNRLALTPEDKLGRDLVVGWMRELGLQVAIDPVGNITGWRAGREDGPPVMTGSHIDTVRTGGLYDGNLGVLAGLEVVEALNRAGHITRHPLVVAVFSNEEGARFPPDMLGSLAYVGGITVDEALDARDAAGQRFGDCLAAIGYAGSAPIGRHRPRAFVELHIEQGPILEETGHVIGVVDSVQGISWTELILEGVSNHAGTTPMRLRRDAALGAMRIGCEARDLALRYGGNQVATVGALDLAPNLVNVVARRARMTVDLRNTDADRLAQAEAELFARVEAIAQAEGLSVTRRTLARFDPVPFASGVIDRVARVARQRDLPALHMPSGAGHDAQMLARICPAGMIFVPSRNGISHNVAEYTAPEHLAAGLAVLGDVLIGLADGHA